MSKYYCQYLSPEGHALNHLKPTIQNSKTTAAILPPPSDKRTHHHPGIPQINICVWSLASFFSFLGQSLVLPFLVTKCQFCFKPRPTKSCQQSINACQTEERFCFATQRDDILWTAWKVLYVQPSVIVFPHSLSIKPVALNLWLAIQLFSKPACEKQQNALFSSLTQLP